MFRASRLKRVTMLLLIENKLHGISVLQLVEPGELFVNIQLIVAEAKAHNKLFKSTTVCRFIDH